MDKHWIIIAAALSVAPLPAAAQTSSEAAPATGNLAGLVTYEDYPQEALDRGEQGAVQVQLTVGTDGRVKRCEIASSSGSGLLDSRTCEIMLERARFTPARDARGRPVEGSFSQRITWRIANEIAPGTRGQGLLLLWITCAMGESAKLAITELTPDQVSERALAACAGLERMVAAEVAAAGPSGGSATFQDLRKSTADKVIGTVREMRAFIEAKPVEEKPRTQ